LLVDETAREARGRPPEAGAKREHAAIDAWLLFTLEKGVPAGLAPKRTVGGDRAEPRRPQVPAAGIIVPPQARLEARHRRLDGRFGGVDAGRAQEEESEQGRQPNRAIGPAPRTVRFLAGENVGADPFARDSGALRGYCGRGGVG
jgi:hypothetical protein